MQITMYCNIIISIQKLTQPRPLKAKKQKKEKKGSIMVAS